MNCTSQLCCVVSYAFWMHILSFMQDMRVDKQERHMGEIGIMRDCCCEVHVYMLVNLIVAVGLLCWAEDMDEFTSLCWVVDVGCGCLVVGVQKRVVNVWLWGFRNGLWIFSCGDSDGL
jgi:hypothetical protein